MKSSWPRGSGVASLRGSASSLVTLGMVRRRGSVARQGYGFPVVKDTRHEGRSSGKGDEGEVKGGSFGVGQLTGGLRRGKTGSASWT